MLIFVVKLVAYIFKLIKIMLRKGLEIGNTVAVLDDVLKGKVVAIDNNLISIETLDGMLFKFDEKELVKIEVEQHELSKFSDINKELLNNFIPEKSTNIKKYLLLENFEKFINEKCKY